jgi:hypothetical protein
MLSVPPTCIEPSGKPLRPPTYSLMRDSPHHAAPRFPVYSFVTMEDGLFFSYLLSPPRLTGSILREKIGYTTGLGWEGKGL